MSELPVEKTEPVAVSSEEPVKVEIVDSSATTEVETVKVKTNGSAGDAVEMEDVKVETAKKNNGAADIEVKPEIKDAKTEGSETKDVKEEKEDEKDVKEENKKNHSKEPRTYQDGPYQGVMKTNRRAQEGKNNSKYDPSVLEVTDDPMKIRAQVEFYFSDSNLPTDNFLWSLTDGSQNLPVSVAKICSFARMKRFQPMSAIIAALKESKFLKVSGPEGEEGVSRVVPYDPKDTVTERERERTSRSVYAKGFGDEEPSTQFDIEAFFTPYGPTTSIRLRRTEDKLFKGSVFVEFQDVETYERFLAVDPKPLWKGEHVLMIQPKQDYIDRKNEDIQEGRIEPKNSNYTQGFGGGRGRGRGRGRGQGGDRGGDRGGNRGGFRDRNDRDRGDRDPNDWKKRREEDRANGFKDDRKGGRGRGRGRGGRGGNRDREDGNGRLNDRNRERDEKNGDGKSESSPKNEKKRPREDEGGSEQRAKKEKVETATSEAAPAASPPSKKRAREDDGGAEENSAKKVDTKGAAVEAS